MQKITLLGSTGSIGRSALDVISRHPDAYQVFALTANSNVELLVAQCQQFRPAVAVIKDDTLVDQLAERLQALSLATVVLSGEAGLCQVSNANEVDTVLAAIVGAAGLEPTLAAVKSGKRVLLANKESLVMAGGLFMDAVATNGCTLLPIDSEHNAIFQCLPRNFGPLAEVGVERILLTASGGPFRTTPLEQLLSVTPDQACAHPNWSMGRKISVDSATMMNKGLELIEACWLFDAKPEQVQVVIHPQSVIHSMVQYTDGSVLAQMGNPDMRTPIAHALAWPSRIDSGVEPLDLFAVARLDFEPPDLRRFPCLRLAMQAAEAGNTMAAVVNAANEVAVEAFLQERIGYMAIAEVIEATVERVAMPVAKDLETVKAVDLQARAKAAEVIVRGRQTIGVPLAGLEPAP
ncbi:1-deoxy-D-xylulose-5-phosphate reductoisomerase [Halioxenophilus sp. WMMB6]|uniref:1-deoxy-D-xylulose-5-phosphate reductoisomerase n=1 Tax=Halioxenophilus sp. WMMB6 TaxID=3073815 RepID=UPI00295E23AE|nr:1-deoxy-D-xylulose-5-phosphate reductoisomerase [Halioxenophilus sp. WMMB6]